MLAVEDEHRRAGRHAAGQQVQRVGGVPGEHARRRRRGRRRTRRRCRGPSRRARWTPARGSRRRGARWRRAAAPRPPGRRPTTQRRRAGRGVEVDVARRPAGDQRHLRCRRRRPAAAGRRRGRGRGGGGGAGQDGAGHMGPPAGRGPARRVRACGRRSAAARSSPGAPHRGGGLPASEPGLALALMTCPEPGTASPFPSNTIGMIGIYLRLSRRAHSPAPGPGPQVTAARRDRPVSAQPAGSTVAASRTVVVDPSAQTTRPLRPGAGPSQRAASAPCA